MIKMVVAAWRRPDFTQEQFNERWGGAHARLVTECARAMGFVRYVQSHKIASPELEEFGRSRGWATPSDGLTEVWFDSMESMEAAMASAEGQAASLLLQEDEEKFCNSAKLSAFLAVEHFIFDYARPKNPLKMVVQNYGRSDLTQEQFVARWRGQHAKLVTECSKAMGMVRYVQSEKLPSPDLDEFARSRGWAKPADSLTEVWWESMEAMNAAMGSPEGQAASALLQADEQEFCDSKKLSAFLSAEHVIFDFTR
ncbi:MAG: EthD domain-containing protein [Rhodocyclaceae bacterium]|jgi:quinol monooxygenase YgiN|nr:EthD domain-containing protein [Rhodocyclaceae bacterium]